MEPSSSSWKAPGFATRHSRSWAAHAPPARISRRKSHIESRGVKNHVSDERRFVKSVKYLL
ncbi:hypothetical protein ASPZODRAFT_128690 [Penicilliopsis zonata CBS 506.65]|uniref:Uncharacterized protein n=1 Tax=Penicilliopsis zonata CBS 506.65 TaxID=1073090 RepID=A0A1L9SSJ4_9EURO|nr:hypothetical protein ASPZODRAFT_128690 [Penicilliopsis zonata CBS 506.65]OJJ50077.1 hypothetical protein ASPZODRAFT_128690 [Penicilliopsis zonata CBS 506.65]